MPKTATEIGMIAGGIAIALAAGPIGITLLGSLSICNGMIGIGLTAAVAGTAGLLNPAPLDASNIGPQGQLPVETPNPLWRIIYGIFQFAGAVTFEDGPILNWAGTGDGLPCESQIINRVQTLACHQIAGFLAVVLDGQTFNFGTDLVLLTPANNQGGLIGPPGMWGFTSTANPWTGVIFFAFDAGDPGYAVPPFPYLLPDGVFLAPSPVGAVKTGSTRWLPTALQRGRAKVHILIHFSPSGQFETWGPGGGAPQPYVLGSGRIPVIEFKVAGRIIRDYRVNTDWKASTAYAQFAYVLFPTASGPIAFVQQQAGGGVSGGALPNFAASIAFGSTVNDGSCVWLNCRIPTFAAGMGATALNLTQSSKLGGPGGAVLIADAWQGGQLGFPNRIIEAPIGWLQQQLDGNLTGATRPNFATAFGALTADGAANWRCLGRSPYATCLPDADGTANQGGFSNPALVIADYLQTPKNQFGLGATLTADSIDTVIAAANICDEPVVIEVFPVGT